MMWIENETFVNQEIKLDFTRWKNCRFIGCNMIIKYGEFDLNGNKFENCKWMVAGQAQAIMKVMAFAFPTIPLSGNAPKDPSWVERALDWINQRNPETVKKWIYEKVLKAEDEVGGEGNVSDTE